jgi:hypothetical protein
MTKAQPKKQEAEKTEQQQNPTIKLPPEVKEELENMKVGEETVADVIRRLMITKTVKEASKEGMVTLILPEKSYMQVLAFQPSQFLSEILQKARV